VPRISERSSDFQTQERMTSDSEVQVCPSCGRGNPASHKFCGQCGTPLPLERPQASDSAAEERRRESEPFEHSISNPSELSLFRSFRPSDSSGDGYWEEQRSPYRIWIGLVIALMIAGLGYMAWRTSKSGTQNAHETPPPPVSAEKPVTPAPAPAPEATAKKTTAIAESAPPVPEEKEAGKSVSSHTTSAPKKQEVGANESARPQGAIDNGSTELAEARRYQAAGDGAEAEKWLWKSVAKHNGEATVALADLYLKGEGVPKNCDQARVLLDSAARKGVPGAGERLRNLQAFGCQ
jgi:ribosomal protein L32